MNTNIEKFNTVIDKNTYFFYNADFEYGYETYIQAISETLLYLKRETDNFGLDKALVERFLIEREYGLRALLALTGISNEYLKRLITLVRIVDNEEFSALFYKN